MPILITATIRTTHKEPCIKFSILNYNHIKKIDLVENWFCISVWLNTYQKAVLEYFTIKYTLLPLFDFYLVGHIKGIRSDDDVHNSIFLNQFKLEFKSRTIRDNNKRWFWAR
ncbi:hypothetical protein FWK35_00024571 [Aphis craccivora]|uniref:Uncharacterized protein n=1 Tax=Aphis craccivora TaxID=307492 RepID=A0A6G0YJQ8_APHCR|nr:hypothetical protein FWK35_00024571 [Aphis craccivora]